MKAACQALIPFLPLVALVSSANPTCYDGSRTDISIEVSTTEGSLCMPPSGGIVRLVGQLCGESSILWNELHYTRYNYSCEPASSRGSAIYRSYPVVGFEHNSSLAQQYLGTSCGTIGTWAGSAAVPTECDLTGECDYSGFVCSPDVGTRGGVSSVGCPSVRASSTDPCCGARAFRRTDVTITMT